MKSFLQFSRQLDEKQIQYGNNANYGQVVFFAGGAGSGKGFSISNFIDASKFKIRDVDKLKSMFMTLPKMLEKYPEIKSFSLKNPDHVLQLHAIVKKENIPEKQLMAWFSSMKDPTTLPNILFDATLKDMGDMHQYVPQLIQLGYRPENIHLTWVLTDYSVAVVRNKERDRVVPDDILLATHSGAALTMQKILSGALPKYINGSITIVLNNPEEVTFYQRDVKSSDVKPNKVKVVKTFNYITVKKAGKPLPSFPELDKQMRETIWHWVMSNAPKISEIEKAWNNH